jgi:site-specific recombinase XerD
MGRLYLRVVHGSGSASVTTDYRVWENEWDAAGRQLRIPRGGSPRAKELMEYQRSMHEDMRRLENVITELERQGFYTAADVTARYRSLAGMGMTGYVEKLVKELDINGCNNTARSYRNAVARFREFNDGRDVGFERVTAQSIREFQLSLKSKGLSANTVAFYLRTLRVIYHRAITQGYISGRAENPFTGIFTGVAPTRKRALTMKELASLSALDPTLDNPKQRLSESDATALAMFLFCCHARGMCFVDMAHLKKSDIHGDMIRYRRRKTGRPIELKIVPAMRKILEWMAPRVARSEYLFPVLAETGRDLQLQYESGLRLQNKCLKRIARICGIESERLTTHVSRHSWATIARDQGLPIAVISEGLGHSNQRTTEIYLASLEQSVLDSASLLVSKALLKATATVGSNPR